MAYNGLHFSRYTHSFSRGSVVAVFHALKMKPLYLAPEILGAVTAIVNSPEVFTDDAIVRSDNGESLLHVIELLLENRVLNATEGRDDEVISFFRQTAGGLQVRIAYFILAECCNLACTYCFERTPSHTLSKVLMSKDVALKSIEFFERMLSLHPSESDEKNIIFYGGEPLLNYRTLVFVLQEIKHRERDKPSLWSNTKLSLVTNGTLLTKERILELRSYGLDIGISIDGPESITNTNRFYPDTRGAYKDARRAIDLCKEANVPFALSLTLSEIAVRHPDDVMRFIEEVSPASIGFNILLGGANTPYPGYNEDAAQLLISAFTEFRKIGLFEDRMMRKVKVFSRQQVYPFDCGATGASQVVFAPSGQVGICHGYLADKKYFPTTVEDTEFIPSSDPTFLEWSRRTPLQMDACRDCVALGICGGGCPMNAERTKGSIFDLDERFCVHAKKVLEWLVWDLYDNADRSSP
jgi:uncharacterized protein